MRAGKLVAAGCWVVLLAIQTEAGTVVLKKSWVNAYENRATIDASVDIDHVKSQPNPVGKGSQDGDLHMASRSDAVGLPFVSEIANAAEEPEAMKIAHNAQGGEAVPISGAWRLWFEHPSKDPQIQGQPVPVAENTNPLHVFEIHPVSSIGGKDVRDSFHPIVGKGSGRGAAVAYQAYDATTAFEHYEALQITVQPSATAVTLTAPMIGYNYAEFFAQLGQRLGVQDGTLVLAQIQDEEGNSVSASTVRLVFVKGTQPEKALQEAKAGDVMHLLGIPRVNLERIVNLMGSMSPGQRVTVKLPYEMIVVGAYSESQ